MRWARAMACHSVVGLSCGSQITTTDAAWMFSPTPPATICATSTAPWPAAENSSIKDLPLRGRNRSGQRAEHMAGKRSGDLVEDVAEVGEHDDSAAVVLGLFDDLDQSLQLRGLGSSQHRRLAHGHEIAGGYGRAVRGGVLVGEREPFIDFDQIRQLGEHVFLVAPQIRRRHLAAELARREFVRVDDERRLQVGDEVAELLDPVLQRRAGEQHGAVTTVEDAAGVPRAKSVGVLDVVRLVDQQVVAARLFEAQSGVFGVVRQQFFHPGFGGLDGPHNGFLTAFDGRVVELGA